MRYEVKYMATNLPGKIIVLQYNTYEDVYNILVYGGVDKYWYIP